MSTIVGGLRARLIRDSIYHCIYEALANLGWFDTGRQHRAIVFTGTIVDQATEIPLNTIGLSDEDLIESDFELGSTGVETRWTYYVDFFAEDDVIGKHLIHDVRDIVGGRMSSIGRADASIEIFNYTEATPSVFTVVDIENAIVDRAVDFPKAWLKHWYTCRFDVVDHYYDEAV